MDGKTALRLFSAIARENRRRLFANEELDGLPFALNPVTYATKEI